MKELKEIPGEVHRNLKSRFGDRYLFDSLNRILYATDASAYREIPLGVVLPNSEVEIQDLVKMASDSGFSLIPRTAGTSLAGQVVGPGLILDVSKHMNAILELNIEEKWVRVQPGVVRDDLNRFLNPYGLYFGPETSTANRAMMGGMVGNNSCGSNSVVYGSTREHLLASRAILSDGTIQTFESEDAHEKLQTLAQGSLIHNIYKKTLAWLSDKEIREEIRRQFPKASIKRRNTGYALDLLLDQKPFQSDGNDFNFNALLAGSEGTLAIFSELKLNLVPLPPPFSGLLAIHCSSIDEALRANLIALEFDISASELIDHYILDCTKNNLEQSKNRFFVQGEPKAILVVEFSRQSQEEVKTEAKALEDKLRDQGLGQHFPLLLGEEAKAVWALRKAGLGLLGNMPGDAKPVAVIEDTAVDVQDLPAYIQEFNHILGRHGLFSVHYAHAGSGELHLRPILNLKTEEGHLQFRQIATDIAQLVKKFEGSLSGEHGDGRLRGEFIPLMVGEKNYQLFRDLKAVWDPKGIFNPGKIVDTPAMDQDLRYKGNAKEAKVETYFDFQNLSLQQHAEQCNGSGDCRKTPGAGGTMCPSFMATRDEKDSTRARANVLREILSTDLQHPFSRKEIKEAMDLCLSCKGCKSECPSNVDVGKMKAEFLQQHYLHKGTPLRTWIIGNFSLMAKMGSVAPWLYNWAAGPDFIPRKMRHALGFSPSRNLPPIASQNLLTWFQKEGHKSQPKNPKAEVWFFVDEFTKYNDVSLGIKAIQLLQGLGYWVDVPPHSESARAFLSKGMLKEARKIAEENLASLYPLVHSGKPLLGVEPSALLSFCDEFPDLLRGENQEKAKDLSRHCFLLDEFIAGEFENGNVKRSQFVDEKKTIRLHGHCHQKALGRLAGSKKMLSIPSGFEVLLIPSGCCGMAGSFGYEAEHYEVSMSIGELILYPTVRALKEGVILAAPGTSCRHQIKDGTGKLALHPIEILHQALLKPEPS